MNAQSTRRRLPTEDRRQEIVAAAVRLLGRPGAFSLSQVATEAGASRALVYHYFSDRETLHATAVGAAAADLLSRLVTDGRPPIEQLSHSVGQYVAFAEEHGDAFLAILGGSGRLPGEDDEIARVVESVRRRVLDLVTETLDLGEPSAPLRMCCNAWVAFAEHMTLEWLVTHDLDRDDLHQLLSSHLLGTLSTAAETDTALAESLERALLATTETTSHGRVK